MFKEIADGKDYVIYNEGIEPIGIPLVRRKPDEGSFADQMADYTPISRPRRNIPKSTQSISDILDAYFLTIDNDSTIREDTRRKKKRGV